MGSFALCFTGISGSGKTTLANEVSEKLRQKCIRVQVIDGDILREQLGDLFGYTREERMRQSRVVRVLTKYLMDQGINVIIAVVAPYEELRAGFREYLGENYLEVYVECPYEVCAQRDVKGYYELYAQKRMNNMNGADDVYEVPQKAELTVKTSKMAPEECVGQIMQLLQERGYGV